MLERERPSAMLLDLIMPEMDGYALLDTLQQESTGPDIPVVVYTAKTLTEAEIDALCSRGVIVLMKGHNNTVEVIMALLNAHTTARRARVLETSDAASLEVST